MTGQLVPVHVHFVSVHVIYTPSAERMRRRLKLFPVDWIDTCVPQLPEPMLSHQFHPVGNNSYLPGYPEQIRPPPPSGVSSVEADAQVPATVSPGKHTRVFSLRQMPAAF
jgi:hypothetical protein